MKHTLPILLSVTALGFLFLGEPARAAENPSRIGLVDDLSRVTLPNTTHPLTRIAQDAGALDTNTRLERMILVLGPSDEMQLPVRTMLDSLHTKRSPQYHAWLTPTQFGERFGPSQADIAKITAWLQQQGFDGIKTATGRSAIEFSGSVQAVNTAFRTQMRSFKLGTQTHVANASDISIPSAMVGVVPGVLLDNFSFTQPALSNPVPVQRDASGKLIASGPSDTNGGGSHFLSPGDLATIYNIAPLYKSGTDGTGETIAIVARSNISLADLETFRQVFTLPPNDPNIVIDGTDPGFSGTNDDAIEASLDTQWAGAIAPNATIDVVVSSSSVTTDGALLSAAYIVDNNLADVMSMSFESCEQTLGPLNSYINALWQQAAAQGISVFVASGDQGAAGCDPNAPSSEPAMGGLAVSGVASTAFNTAVGGTQFDDTVSPSTYWSDANEPGQISALGYIPEAVWNESCSIPACDLYLFDSSGGGVSTLYAKPSWQSTSILGVPNDQQRDVPDVSLPSAGHTPYLICVSGFAPCEFTTSDNQLVLDSAGAVSGTSASAPSFAGMMALVDQKQGGRQGLANYVLYKLAASETFANCNSSNQTNPSTPPSPTCVFNDVTQGDNGVPGNDVLSGTVPPGDEDGQLGYNALPGYDSATGLGSVNATNLVNAWNAANFQGSSAGLVANRSTSIQHGQPVSFSVTVNALSGGSGVPTGLVSLLAENGQGIFSPATAVVSGPLVNGVFSVSTSALPGGTYNVVARYPGDGTFAASDSNPLQVTVTPESSSLALSAYDATGTVLPSPISESYGVFFAVHAAVSAASGNGIPTGMVTFSDGGAAIAEVPLNSAGEAELFNCTTSSFCLTIGTHTITASYSGNSGLNPVVSSQTLIFNISKGNLSVEQEVVGFTQPGNPSGSVAGDQFSIFFLNVGSIPPTGTITYVDNVNNSNNNLAPPITLDATGHIPVQTFVLPAGTNTVTAEYSGDNNYSAVSGPVVLTIAPNGKLVAQITVTPLTASMAVGQTASFNVKVTGGASQPEPTGQILLFNSSQSLLTGDLQLCNLTSGSATAQFTMPSTVANILVEYEGDSNYATTLSNPLAISVSKATPAVSVSSSLPTTDPNRQLTLVASVTPPAGAFIPDGTVQFYDSFNGGAPTPFGPVQALQPSLGAC